MRDNNNKLENAVDKIIATGSKELALMALDILWEAYYKAIDGKQQADKEKAAELWAVYQSAKQKGAENG